VTIERCQVLLQVASVKEVIDPAQQMVARHMILTVEGVEKTILPTTVSLIFFFPHSISPSRIEPAIPDIRLIGIEDDFFILRHSATQRLCHARRVAAQKRDASA
jgi:hypothetical protein